MSNPPGKNRRTAVVYSYGGAAQPSGHSNNTAPGNQMMIAPKAEVRIPVAEKVGDHCFLGMAVGEQLDAFRELRTRLLAKAEAAGLQKFAILVVPVTANSGANFIARNLAAAFTLQERQRVVLMDCNLRKPSQHIAFNVMENSDGLFDFLENNRTRAETLLFRTELPGLFLIAAGRPSSAAREYFSSSAMRSLLEWLRTSPCYLVLDGPPVAGSPDARILSELVDFVVLVAGYGQDTIEGISKAAALFSPAKFAGVVFNNQV